MKLKIYILIPFTIIACILLSSYGGENADHSSGAPAGYTGSPGDGHNCTSCHGGSSSTVTGWITSNIPASGYIANTTYTITATATGSGNKGFEVSPQNVAGALLGTLTAGSGSKLVGSGKYVTHNAPVGGSSATWNFSWTAPATGTGTVTFYGAFAVTEPVTKLCTLVVNENIPLGVTATATPATILTGSASQLDATPAGGSGIYSYSWTSNPAGFTSSLQNPTVSPTVTTQYTVTVNDGSGNASDNTTVTVIPNNLAVFANAAPSSILSGQTSQLSANASGGSGLYNYSWTSIPGGFFSTLQNPVVSPTVSTQYIVQANDGYQVSADTTLVTVTSGPLSATAYATPGTICLGQTSQLNVIPTGGSGTYSYSWTSLPAGFTSNIQNPVVSPVQHTQYIASVNDGSATTTDTTEVNVTLIPSAAAGPDTIYCVSINQIPLSGIASNYQSVTWSTSGTGTFSNTSNLTSIYYPSNEDKSAAQITLTLTATPLTPCTNAVSDSRTIFFSPCNGISKQNQELTFTLHPNPSQGVIFISADLKGDENVNLLIFDLNGNALLKENFRVTGNKMDHQLDLSYLPKGVYFVRILTNNGTKTEKLILQ